MTDTLELDAGWEFAWSPAGQLGSPAETDELCFYPARVPGTNVQDLLANGRIPDPFEGVGFRSCYWIEMQDFWYRTRFEIDAGGSGSPALLCFEGVDTCSDIWLNGQHAGATSDMFCRYRFRVEHLLCAGQNELVVKLRSPVREGRLRLRDWKLDPFRLTAAFGTPERLPVRKMQMSYGWDNHPRLVLSGIYRPVTLVRTDSARIRDAALQTVDLKPDHSEARLHLNLAVDGVEALTAPEVVVEGRCGAHTFEERLSLEFDDDGEACVELVVREPLLWWPNRLGEPNLYEVTLQLHDNNQEVDRRLLQTGIRTIRVNTSVDEKRRVRYRIGAPHLDVPDLDGGDMGPWSHLPLPEPEHVDVHALRFVVNGLEFPVVGADWQPCDAVYSRVTPERIRHLLAGARDIGFSMIRVWGGGYVEAPAFYQTCSELGLMVWQDFPFASGVYPQEPSFLDEVEMESADIVRQLRGHACLAAWCGDNESDMMYGDRGHDPACNRINHDILPRVLKRLDPDRYYHPSSPFGYDYPRSSWSGDKRNWGAWQPFDNLLHIRREEARFISEAGAYALPSEHVIQRYIPAAEQWPLNSETWQLHQGSVDTYRRGFWHRNASMWSAYGTIQGLRQTIKLSQFAQAWGAKTLVEYMRGRWPETGGVLWWKLDDCWPCMDGGIWDYSLRPRLVAKALTHACQPVLIFLAQPPDGSGLELVLVNSTHEPAVRDLFFEAAKISATEEILHKKRQKVEADPWSVKRIPLSTDVGGFDPSDVVFILRGVDSGEIMNVTTLSTRAAWHCYQARPWIGGIWNDLKED